MLCLANAISACAFALPAAPQAERPWTLLVYGAADNNADGPILEFLDGVRAALDDDPGIELVLFIDRHEDHSRDRESLGADFTGARLYRLRRGEAERLDGGEGLPRRDADVEVDSADPQLLRRFVAWGKARFPAKRTGLLIYSHADGRAMCPDEESGNEMGISALARKDGPEVSVDFLGLELCTMGGIEVAYEWRPGNGGFSADVLVAIPNAGPPLDWHRAFERIRSKDHPSSAPEPHLDPASMSAVEFGKLVIEEGERGRRARMSGGGKGSQRVHHEAAACYDLREAGAVKQAVDALAVALAAGAGESKADFEALRGGDYQPNVMCYGAGDVREMPYFDLPDLLGRAATWGALAPAVREKARAALVAVDRFVISSFGMDEYRDFEAGLNGVFIVFPKGDGIVERPLRKDETVWARAAWYSPLPAQKAGGPSRAWAFLADGASAGNGKVENWYELLDSWYDPDPQGNGGVNGYRW